MHCKHFEHLNGVSKGVGYLEKLLHFELLQLLISRILLQIFNSYRFAFVYQTEVVRNFGVSDSIQMFKIQDLP